MGEKSMFNFEKAAEELKEFFISDLFVDLKKEEIGHDMRIGQDLGVDSLGFTEIMAYLEDTYSISISKEEYVPDNFRTINKILSFVEKKLGD